MIPTALSVKIKDIKQRSACRTFIPSDVRSVHFDYLTFVITIYERDYA